jgi:DNA repair exonuclease SbcCD nuclease subunit
MIKNIIYIIAIALFFSFDGNAQKAKGKAKAKSKMRFAFMTDVHLRYNNTGNCFAGFQQALDTALKRNVDFIVFGGDCVHMDGYVTFGYADTLFVTFKKFLDKMPVKTYPAIGNHDVYYNPEKGYKEGDELFKEYLKDSYYTFEQKGVRFFVLNSVQPGEKPGYNVGKKQMEWIQSQLQNVSAETPIVIVTHVPVYSISEGGFANSDEVLKAFEKHNLQLVLQGHIHLYEEIYSQKIWYVSAGSICSGWWDAIYQGTEEGFLIVDVYTDNNFTWNYVDYGWEVQKTQ